MSGNSDKTKNIIIIVLSVAVLCLIVAVVVLSVLLAKKDDEKEPSATDQFYAALLTGTAKEKEEQQQKEQKEKDNRAADLAAIEKCMAAAEKVAIDPAYALEEGTVFSLSGVEVLVLTLNSGGGIGGQIEAARQDWKNLSEDHIELQSDDFKTLTISIKGTLMGNGSVVWEAFGIEKIFDYDPNFARKWGLK